MEPTTTSPHQTTTPQPPPVAQSSLMTRLRPWLGRTSSAFVAEYCLMLLMLGSALASVVWLVYSLCNLIVLAADGTGTAVYLQLFLVWLAVTSLISLPATLVLWQRTQGELAKNSAFKGELPKGGARGFRTFWLIVAVLTGISMLSVGIYAPIAVAIEGGKLVDVLVETTLPSVVNLAVVAFGIVVVTSVAARHTLIKRGLFAVAVLTVVLFAVDITWATLAKHEQPVQIIPVSPYTSPYSPPYDYKNDNSPYNSINSLY